MRITCAISGIKFDTSFLESTSISHTAGYFHPIFAVSYTQLHHLYTAHTKGLLTCNDSYLLFMAFLHSSGQVEWKHPATVSPTHQRVKSLVENNLKKLITVLEKSAIIQHPSFSQPSFSLSIDNADLTQIPSWITAWGDNLTDFCTRRADLRQLEDLYKVESRLSKLILGGERPEEYTAVIASWASKCAGFPTDKDEEWKRIIRSCFNTTKMFNTPLALIQEIKAYCELNIESGSIHSHTLYSVLKTGIKHHIDYLGGSPSGIIYTLLPVETSKASTEEQKAKADLAVMAANAPLSAPVEKDYPNSIDFLKARLAFRVNSFKKPIQKEPL